MSNLLRAQWFRLTHSWLGYGCLACFAALTLLVAMGSMNIRFMGEGYLPGNERMSPFWFYSDAFVTLGFVPIVAGFFVSGLVTDDLNGGTIKNLLQGPGARRAYGGAVLIWGLAASALFVALGMASVEVIAWARGIPLEAVGVGPRLAWFVQAVLCSSALAASALFVALGMASVEVIAWARGIPLEAVGVGPRLAWFVQAVLCSSANVTLVTAVAMATGSRVLGMATALVLGLGVANTGLTIMLEGADVLALAEGRYLPGSLAWWVGQLANGPLYGWGWLVRVSVVGAVGVAGTLAAARRRGLA